MALTETLILSEGGGIAYHGGYLNLWARGKILPMHKEANTNNNCKFYRWYRPSVSPSRVSLFVFRASCFLLWRDSESGCHDCSIGDYDVVC